MTSWLESILAELKAVTEEQKGFAEPDSEPGPKDHVVGVAGEDIRGLAFLLKQYFGRALEIMASIPVTPKSQRGELERDCERFHRQGDVIKEIFWMSCRAAFPELWDKSSIGIRKGWQVVWSDTEEHSHKTHVPLDVVLVLEEMLVRGRTPSAAPDRSGLN